VAQRVDQRERDLAAQVAGDRLADGLGVAGEVEQVVDDLKRDAEIEAVVAQRCPLRRDLAEQAADLGAAAKEYAVLRRMTKCSSR
jgi:hypothetical protein